MTRYDEFVHAKLAIRPPVGLTGEVSLPDSLFPQQKALTSWALKRGRAAKWWTKRCLRSSVSVTSVCASTRATSTNEAVDCGSAHGSARFITNASPPPALDCPGRVPPVYPATSTLPSLPTLTD